MKNSIPFYRALISGVISAFFLVGLRKQIIIKIRLSYFCVVSIKNLTYSDKKNIVNIPLPLKTYIFFF